MKTLHLITILALSTLALSAQVTIQTPSGAHATIQSAINAAQTGDTVEILPGTYVENLLIADKVITLKAQVRGTVVVDGSGLGPTIKVERSDGTVLDGLEVTNGQGITKLLVGSPHTYGGGLHVSRFDPTTAMGFPTSISILKCKFHGNNADYGAAIYVEQLCSLDLLESCEITNNTGTLASSVLCDSGPTIVKRCHIHNNPGPGGMHVLGHVEMEDTSIHDQQSGGALTSYSATLRRCLLQDNGYAYIGSTTLSSFNAPIKFRFEDCLITGNGLSGFGLSQLHFYDHAAITNCTIVDNNCPAGEPMITASGFAQVTIDNSIVRNNGAADFGTEPPPPWMTWMLAQMPAAATIVTNSCTTVQDISGPNNIWSDPLFLDPLNDDYRLQPGSPCVDTGDMTLPYVSSLDLQNRNRVVLGEVDMGCYEGRSLAHHPASAGRVGLNGGGPYDLLEVNGSSGGLERTVTVPIGSASVVTMAQPPTTNNPTNFVIFGVLAEADAESVVTLPFGIGDLMFAPTPLVPAFLHWLFFTYTDNFNPAAGQFIGSTPTPWSSGFGPAIPFPLQLTLQGVIEETPGVFVTTNAVVFRVE